MKIKCPSCGMEMEVIEDFCPYCGLKMIKLQNHHTYGIVTEMGEGICVLQGKLEGARITSNGGYNASYPVESVEFTADFKVECDNPSKTYYAIYKYPENKKETEAPVTSHESSHPKWRKQYKKKQK